MSQIAEQIIEMLANKYDGRTDHANREALARDIDQVLDEGIDQLAPRLMPLRGPQPQVESAGYDIATQQVYLNLEDGTRLRIPPPVLLGMFEANQPAESDAPVRPEVGSMANSVEVVITIDREAIIDAISDSMRLSLKRS
jgi:hypothetical protein